MDKPYLKEAEEWKNKTDEALLFEAGRSRIPEAAPVEMMRRLKNSILENKNAINNFNNQSSKLSKIMIGIAGLQILIMLFQIAIMFKKE